MGLEHGYWRNNFRILEGVGRSEWVLEGAIHGKSQWVSQRIKQSSSQWEMQLVSLWVMSQCVLEHGGWVSFTRLTLDRPSYSYHPIRAWNSGWVRGVHFITILISSYFLLNDFLCSFLDFFDKKFNFLLMTS